ncbi:MAG: imidazole glycerol phosphate synthase subunit HisH [Oligoflexales bacterium]
MSITIVDYGSGNLKSVFNALYHLAPHENIFISDKANEILNAERLILPGVGYFKDAMENLKKKNLIQPLNEAVLERKTPILAICLGMQLLFEKSSEGGDQKGLGWIEGHIEKISAKAPHRVPHMGWNDVHFSGDKIFDGLGDAKPFYFVHSYHACCPKKYVTGTSWHSYDFPVSVRKGHIHGMQFHPEKSHHSGLHVLKNFIEQSKRGASS